MNTFSYTIQFIESLALHNITQPTTSISFLINPWHRICDIKLWHRFQFRYNFCRCRESDSLSLCTFRQRFQEFKNIRRQWLSHTKRAQFHEDINHLFLLRQYINPINILIGKQRIFSPIRIGEAQADVVRKFEIPQQKLKTGSLITVINIMRTLPSQDMFSPFRQHPLEAHRSYQATNFIRINQTRVAEYFRFFTKHLFHLITLTKHFFAEAILVGKWRQTMWIRFTQKLTTSCFIQLVQ